MKPLSDMTRLELAAYIGAEFKRRNINVVLSGGSWFYHGNDTECLEQAVLVAHAHEIDLAEVRRWSVAEGMGDRYEKIKARLLC